MESQAERLSRYFRVLGSPIQVRILDFLITQGEANVPSVICAELDVELPSVCYHLKRMMDAGLVEKKRIGIHSFYSINTEVLYEIDEFVTR